LDAAVLSIVIALVGLYSTIIAILVSHEKRLTRIEAKIDILIRYINNKNNKN